MRHVALCLLLACAAPAAPTTSPRAPSDSAGATVSAPHLSSALEPLSWWLGAWDSRGTSEHWIAAGGALYGISLARDGGFEVMIVDDVPARGATDGVLRLWAMPQGAKSVEFTQVSIGERSATFANPAHDFPKTIRYTREGETLIAEVGGALSAPAANPRGTPSAEAEAPLRLLFERGTMTPAPELEAEDRAFAADVATRGLDGLIAAFHPQGAMITGGTRIEGHAAIADAMRDMLAAGTLAWAPIASGRRGAIGYTVGTATYTARTGAVARTSYVTIWREQHDGTWRVWFDTGRPIHE